MVGTVDFADRPEGQTVTVSRPDWWRPPMGQFWLVEATSNQSAEIASATAIVDRCDVRILV